MAVVSIKNKTKSGSLLVGNSAFIPTDFESIATVTVGSGGSSSIQFNSIPGTYQHLQLRYYGQMSANDTAADITFNGSSGLSNFSRHWLYGTGASVAADALTSETVITTLYNYDTTGTKFSTSIFGAGIIDILDYTSTNKNKTLRALYGFDYNGGGRVQLDSGLWFATPTAITSITITPTGGTFVQYSHFALYGIKA